MHMKKLHKSKDSQVVSGIMGGLGEYLEVSPGLLRVGYVTISVFTHVIPGVLLYAVGHFLIPHKKEEPTSDFYKFGPDVDVVDVE